LCRCRRNQIGTIDWFLIIAVFWYCKHAHFETAAYDSVIRALGDYKLDKIVWKNEYNTGILEIDYQHKYFAELINRFSLNLTRLVEKKLLLDFFTEITKYAAFHFCSEENIMKLCNFPDLNTHRNMHYDLINQLSCETLSVELSIEELSKVLVFLKQWFLNHTIHEDRKLYDYLKQLPHDQIDKINHFITSDSSL